MVTGDVSAPQAVLLQLPQSVMATRIGRKERTCAAFPLEDVKGLKARESLVGGDLVSQERTIHWNYLGDQLLRRLLLQMQAAGCASQELGA